VRRSALELAEAASCTMTVSTSPISCALVSPTSARYDSSSNMDCASLALAGWATMSAATASTRILFTVILHEWPESGACHAGAQRARRSLQTDIDLIADARIGERHGAGRHVDCAGFDADAHRHARHHVGRLAHVGAAHHRAVGDVAQRHRV